MAVVIGEIPNASKVMGAINPCTMPLNASNVISRWGSMKMPSKNALSSKYSHRNVNNEYISSNSDASFKETSGPSQGGLHNSSQDLFKK